MSADTVNPDTVDPDTVTTAAAKADAWQVLSGAPTAEELAAIVVVLGNAGSSAPKAPVSDQPAVGGWRAHARRLRRPLHPGPGAWQAAVR